MLIEVLLQLFSDQVVAAGLLKLEVGCSQSKECFMMQSCIASDHVRHRININANSLDMYEGLVYMPRSS